MQPEGEIVLEHKKQWTGVKIIKLILKIAVPDYASGIFQLK